MADAVNGGTRDVVAQAANSSMIAAATKDVYRLRRTGGQWKICIVVDMVLSSGKSELSVCLTFEPRF
jgi:hypothetical protein